MRKTIYSKEGRALSSWLGKQRKLAGLTQRDFAKVLGIHHSIVGKIEKGNRRIDVVELIHYCNALDVDPRDVINEIVSAVNMSAEV